MRIFIALLFLATTTLHAQVGIGTTNPNTAAALDVFSTSKAMLLPRLTTTQRNSSITSPVEGMIIYNTSERKFQGYAGTSSSTTLAQSTVGGTFEYANNSEYQAQTFQVTQSFSSFDISIWSYYVNNGYSGTFNLTIELYQGVPGSSSTFLASQQWVANNLSEKRTFSFTGVALAPNTTYYFLVKPATSINSPAPAIERSGTGNGGYANGAWYIYSTSDASWNAFSDDLRFEVVGVERGWINLH
jgi:hypothetical protein